eukprot:CAMPEP_0116887710 /NCGR_PEP_ID=MMETSP0463-20121206/22331_1 /TAXON_ID=181622 /ORGANISM="Strombidinopsis sp, Strain SopsisLIS2011" /LENGTH=87 /DNA_ID=CAMNT_0004550945 /DNA_START=455 /DNA_END=714 /DNA_ORIENTATION=+
MTLETVGVIRKYISYMDINISMPIYYNLYTLNPLHSMRALACHYTQFVWYRKLFVLFSRYAYFNSFNIHAKKQGRDENGKLNCKSTA